MNLIEKVYAAAQTSVPSTPIGVFGDMNLTELVTLATNALMVVGLAVFLVMLAVGFIKYVTSQGDKVAVENAQKTLTYAVIGGVGLLLVFAFRGILLNLLGADTSKLI